MSQEVTETRVQQYRSNLELLLQQKDSRFMAAVMPVTGLVGKAVKALEQLGSVNPVQRTSRHGPTPQIDTPHDGRWLFPVDWEWADLIAPQDRIRAIVDLDSGYLMNGRAAMARSADDEIIGQFFADANTGENSSGTVTPFPASQVIAAGATGMTVAKLKAARTLLRAAEIDDDDPLWIALSAEQEEDLLNETQMISIDFNSDRVLVDGRLRSFMGFNFIHSERLLVDGAAARRCPCWARSGMRFGQWEDITVRISERADLSYETQVYLRRTLGATRTEEEKVVEILAVE